MCEYRYNGTVGPERIFRWPAIRVVTCFTIANFRKNFFKFGNSNAAAIHRLSPLVFKMHHREVVTTNTRGQSRMHNFYIAGFALLAAYPAMFCLLPTPMRPVVFTRVAVLP